MTLNLQKSRVLRGLIGDERCFESAPFVDATAYNAFVDNEIPTWGTAYAGGNLDAVEKSVVEDIIHLFNKKQEVAA